MRHNFCFNSLSIAITKIYQLGKIMKITTLCLAAACLLSTTANAALESRLGGQAVYDTDLNITWLANANLAATNTFGISGIDSIGRMSWSAAQSWVGAINAANYLGYHDWRLPFTPQVDTNCWTFFGAIGVGGHCTGSEMGHLFYDELGGVAGTPITAAHNANFNLFSNFQYLSYWSGSLNNSSGTPYRFQFYDGSQYTDNPSYSMYILVVRSGNVAAVPVPAAAWLLGSGLLGLVSVARRKGA